MSDNNSNILASAVRYRNPVGKRYTLAPEGKLEKLVPGARTDKATALVFEGKSPEQYFKWVRHLDAHCLQLSGSFASGADGQAVRHTGSDRFAADRSNVKHRKGPGPLLLDFDVKSADEVAALWPEQPACFTTHDEAHDWLCAACPPLAGAAMRFVDSSSSFLSVDGVQVTGRRGIHAEVIIDDATLVPAILRRLHDLSWAGGRGWGFVSRGGAILERGAVDLVMATPTQPFFGGITLLDERITSNRSESVYGNAERIATGFEEWLNPEEPTAIRALQGKLARAEAARIEMRTALAAPAKVVFAAKAQEVAERICSRTGEEVGHVVARILDGGHAVLPRGMELTSVDGEVILAGNLRADEHDGLQVLPPWEPDYAASTYVRFDQHGHPVLHSYAHGYHTLTVEEAPVTPEPSLKRSYERILKAVGRVADSEHPERFLKGRLLLDEMTRVVRNREKPGTVIRLHQRDDGSWTVNNYATAEYMRYMPAWEIVSPSMMARADAGSGQRVERLMSRFMHQHAFTSREQTKLGQWLGSYEEAVIAALKNEVVDYIARERQIDLLSFGVDMFATGARLEVLDKAAVVWLPHAPFPVRKEVPADRAALCVRDYKAHFPRFDRLLAFLAAARFASDGRQAFMWMQALSGFGKNFLFDGVFGKGLDGGGLNITLVLRAEELELALGGKPSPLDPVEACGAWIMFSDEFKAVSSGLKELNNTLRVSPKNRMRGEIRLFSKVFVSDEHVASLTSGGVDAQLANRFSYWKEGEEGVKLDARPLYRESAATYLSAVRDHAATVLNNFVEHYRALGPRVAREKADRFLSAFHDEHRIDKSFGSMADEMADLACDFLRWIEPAVRNKLSAHLSGPVSVAVPTTQQLAHDLIVGWAGVRDKRLVALLSHPDMHVKKFIEQTRSSSEVPKFNARREELQAALGERGHESVRVYDIEEPNKMIARHKGLLIELGFWAGSGEVPLEKFLEKTLEEMGLKERDNP